MGMLAKIGGGGGGEAVHMGDYAGQGKLQEKNEGLSGVGYGFVL
jgi:hypothetical protein